MSRDWTPEELQAASSAMKNAGQMGYEEFTAEVAALEKIMRFSREQRKMNWPCPRCGMWVMASDPIRNALSRKASVYICEWCGLQEALGDMLGVQMPLASWAIAKNENWPLG